MNASFNSGGGLAWPSFGQLDNASVYFEEMRAVNWATGVFAAAYPALAVLQDFNAPAPPCADNPRCPAAPYGNTILRNVAVNLSGGMLIPPVAAAGFPASRFDVRNNLINPPDAGFVEADPRAALNFQLRADSPVYSALNPPFTRIPMECFGPWSGCE